jgi:hypothetical protein
VKVEHGISKGGRALGESRGTLGEVERKEGSEAVVMREIWQTENPRRRGWHKLKDEGRTFGEKYPIESIAAWNSLTGHY